MSAVSVYVTVARICSIATVALAISCSANVRKRLISILAALTSGRSALRISSIMFNSLVFSVLFVARKSRIACDVISLNTPSALTPTSACTFSISPSVICFSNCAILASTIFNWSKYVFVCVSTSLSLRFIISCCSFTSGCLRS